jgi:PAS domain S-box-containing protein
MNPIAKFVVERSALAWFLAVLVAVMLGWGASELLRDLRERERLDHLQTETERRSVEIMSQTLSGNLMGAVAVLGLIEPDVKREALGKLAANNPKVLPILESIGRSYDADGVFLVDENGLATSSWDNSGKPSTGLKLKFRPYYQMAMQGMDNVYAAVSLARGDRSLYFAAPIFADTTSGTTAIGAVVARTGLLKVDNLLRDKADIALLLSPQGVVFASNRKEWIGQLGVKPTPDRIKAIRELKQFGNMFEKSEPVMLPVALDGGLMEFEGRRYAVARAQLQWNDPFGDWTLVMMEDLARVLPTAERTWMGTGVTLAFILIGILVLLTLRSTHRQAVAGVQLAAYAAAQEASATGKTKLASATVRMQRATTLTELAQTFLHESHALLGAMQGVMYVTVEAEEGLRLAGSYACADAPPEYIAIGEGLFGQCAAEKRPQLLAVETGRFVTVRSGLGETEPAALLIHPVLLNDTLLGVIEIAVLKTPDDAARAQLDELVGLLAMNLEIVGRSARTEKMLSATVEAERFHAEQLAFQQALVDTIPYPVFYKDADTRFLGFNRAYEEAFGVTRDTLIGKRVIELEYLPETDRIAYQSEDEAVIASASSIKREMQMQFADGKLHDTLYFVSGFGHADGSAGGLVGTFIDITALKDAEREMDRMADMQRFNRLAQGREHRVLELKREVNALAESMGRPVPYATDLVESVGDHEFAPHPDYRIDVSAGEQKLKLADLVDLDELQHLFASFCESVGIAAAIIDLDAKVLASSRWQRACTDFHRVNPDSCARCIESDTELSLKLQDGQNYTMYKCKNGMTDCASPIIVEGRHLANVFIGQFHLGPPDLDFFRKQAQQFGYPEAEYLKAVGEAPVADEKRLPAILGFLTGFARMVSTMSLAKRRSDRAQQMLEQQATLLQRERVAALSLAEDAEQARIALEAIAKESQA